MVMCCRRAEVWAECYTATATTDSWRMIIDHDVLQIVSNLSICICDSSSHS